MRKSRTPLQHFSITLLLLSVCCVRLISGIARRDSGEIRCIEREKRALLQFKNGITDDYGFFSSWGTNSSQDCCLWRGVGCSNRTDHVTMLDLHGYWSVNLTDSVGFTGEISSSLLELHNLKHMDLSFNTFTRIPEFIGSLKILRYLNLSYIGILEVSKVPSQLGNLTYLQTLDLTDSSIILKDTEWISRLSSLEYLSLSFVRLSGSKNLLVNVLTRLPSLSELRLSYCNLLERNAKPLLSVANFSRSLSILDLSSNSLHPSSIYPWLFNFSGSLTNIDLTDNILDGTIPEAFGTLRSLQHLDMKWNEIKGGIPRSFGNLSNLVSLNLDENNLKGDLISIFHNLSGPAEKSIKVLELSYNKLSGSLPDFTTFTALRKLYLQNNELDGSFPEKFEQISNLIIIDLSVNQISGLLPDLSALSSLRELYFEVNRIEGPIAEKIMLLSKLECLGVSLNMLNDTISETHLTNLSHLTYLDLSYNSLVLELGYDWSPTFSLDAMLMSSCKLGPSFPTWLQTQKSILAIDISNAQINDTVPSWFWEQITPALEYLNLSSNQIYGIVPDLLYGDKPHIDLSYNRFFGQVPFFPSETRTLALDHNMFSGSVTFLCNLTNTILIDVSNNKLSGELPDCWMNLSDELYIINLEDNKFSGRIPTSLGSLRYLIMLSMRSNYLTGELPSSLKNCTFLQFLDVGENNLSGRLPAWIGRSLVMLRVLSLSSNGFHGNMPTSICGLANIKILDISVNKLPGTIPTCLSNLKGMTERQTGQAFYLFLSYSMVDLRPTIGTSGYMYKALLQWKGMKYEYGSTLGLVTSLDLSSNRFSGQLPTEITNLSGLVGLNLSRNKLTWKIPGDIGRLSWLDFLDLSRNNLVGQIPASLSQLTKIGVLDVSYNNLSGRIPTSTQLQSFDAASYSWNSALCGLPLPNPCPGDFATEKPPTAVQSNELEDQDKLITREFFISLLIGSAFGFWGVCGTLIVKDSWRYAYFKFLINVKDWINNVIAMSYARLKRCTRILLTIEEMI